MPAVFVDSTTAEFDHSDLWPSATTYADWATGPLSSGIHGSQVVAVSTPTATRGGDLVLMWMVNGFVNSAGVGSYVVSAGGAIDTHAIALVGSRFVLGGFRAPANGANTVYLRQFHPPGSTWAGPSAMAVALLVYRSSANAVVGGADDVTDDAIGFPNPITTATRTLTVGDLDIAYWWLYDPSPFEFVTHAITDPPTGAFTISGMTTRVSLDTFGLTIGEAPYGTSNTYHASSPAVGDTHSGAWGGDFTRGGARVERLDTTHESVPWLRWRQRDDAERIYSPSETRGGIPTSGQRSQRQGLHGTYW